jgi:type IV secretory pathway TrbD component
MTEESSGYRITIHRSLTEPILLAGVPRGFCIINFTIAAAVILGLHVLIFFPVNIIVHFIAVMLIILTGKKIRTCSPKITAAAIVKFIIQKPLGTPANKIGSVRDL